MSFIILAENIFASCTLRHAALVVLIFPKALSVDPKHPGSLAVLILRMLTISVFGACFTGCIAFLALWIFTNLFMRRSLKVVARATMVFAIAFCTFVGTWYCAFIIPGRTGEILEACLMLGNWIAAFVIAIRILWKGERSSDARPAAHL